MKRKVRVPARPGKRAKLTTGDRGSDGGGTTDEGDDFVSGRDGDAEYMKFVKAITGSELIEIYGFYGRSRAPLGA
eukprot:14832072-Heterocapsa_arctica.AAC.1